MVDFLARLAERTLRTVPVAQPILTSRFAPGQVMAAPILETEAWSTASAVAVQDAATAQRARTGDITLMQGRQEEDMATARATTTQQAEAKSAVREDDLALDEIASEVNAPEALISAGTIHRPLWFVGESEDSNGGTTLVAGSPELPAPLTENPTFVEEPHEREVEISLPSPESGSMNSLPTGQGSSHIASVSGMPLRQNEPVALEQEEGVSFQLLMEHNSVLPLVEEGHVGVSFEREISLQLEETLLPIASIPADPLIEMRSGSAISRDLEHKDERRAGIQDDGDIVSQMAVGEELGDHKGLPLRYYEAASEEVDLTSPAVHTTPQMVSSKRLLHRRQEGAGPTSTTDDKKGLLSHPQSPSPLQTVGQKETLLLEKYVEEAQLSSPRNIAPEEHTIELNTKQGYNASANQKDELLTVEQHLLVSQAHLPQGTAPHEQTSGSLINVFTSESVRNLSRAPLAQHNSTDPHSGSAAASAAEASPTPPSIHITIGRIDVRAVTSPGPTPPSKPARPSPLLSLDDYLKQGKGGRQ